MKKKYWLLILVALTMLFTLAVTAFAAGYVLVYFTAETVPLSVGDTTTVRATVQNAEANAVYTWKSSDEKVVKIEGTKENVKVTAVGDGYAKVTLTVKNRDGISDFDFFKVAVDRTVPPVIVRGGDDVSMVQGDTQVLTAFVTGGSENYSFDWSATGSAALTFTDKLRNNATVSAGRTGTGEVILTVYDLEDLTNNDTVVWKFTVTGGQQQTEPPEIQINHGTIDLGAGASGSLMVAATGGSGSYDYFWQSDNPSVASVYGAGEQATVTAADTLIPGANTAQISVYVRDRETGLTSNTATCIVAVSGGNANLDVQSSTIIGTPLDAANIADVIDEGFRRNFGSNISLSASVMLENAGSAFGSFRLQDGSMVRSGTGYVFAVFEDMVFQPGAAGTFSTGYRVVDGGNTISGTIRISVSGGIAVTSATLDKATVDLPLNSNQYLTLTVAPLNASYTVSWAVTDSRIVTVGGTGNRVTLTSGSIVGKTTVIATIVDSLGNQFTRNCVVNVYQPAQPVEVRYDASLTIMLGSDYYGTKLSEAMTNSFTYAFGYYPAANDQIFFSSLGNSRFGTLLTRDGVEVVKGRAYTFLDWIDMYFAPHAAGTYQLSYQLSHGPDKLYGTINIIIESASLNVSLSPTTLQMAPYSSQYISLSITPIAAYYRVSWSSSDPNIVKVSGSNTTAVINSVGSGTATVYAVVTDARGIEIRRGCTVVVSAPVSNFNPSVSTTLGIPYTGTGTSSAMRSQFASVYGITLQDNAIIRFSSVGNNAVGIMRLSDGTPIRANTDYTLAQYVGMYTQPVAAGTFSVPYTLSYSGKSLSGTVSVIIKPASVSTNLKLSSRASYWFSDPINGSTGSAILSTGIRNAAGSNWSYIRFGSTSNSFGTLYADRSLSALRNTNNVTSSGISQLYFVPGSQNGTFTVPYTVYTAAGTVIAEGSLSIVIPGGSFTDVPANAYYAQAVSWAVSKAVTSGTTDTTFSPDRTVTRGQAVTFLWRAAGQPKAISAVNPFTDVKSGAYYYDAVLWAVQQGITSGTTDTTFSPDSTLNRDQLLTFLCRASGGYAGGSDWSQLAVNWANSHGVLSGVPGTFVAKSACPRCDVVYYLWKAYNG